MDAVQAAEPAITPAADASAEKAVEVPPLGPDGKPKVKWGKFWVTQEKQDELRAGLIARNKAGKQKPVVDEDTAGYRQTLAWVLERVWEESCPKGASALARSLWQAAVVNRAEFVSKNMPLLLRGEKQEEPEGEDEAVRGNLQLIEEWFAQQAGVCPHCGRGP